MLNVVDLTVTLLFGSSKWLFDSNLSIFIVLSIFWVVPSFAVIFTTNVLLPDAMLDILIFPSNPALSPLGYPGYNWLISALFVP